MSKRLPVPNASIIKTSKPLQTAPNRNSCYSRLTNQIYIDNKIFKDKIRNTVVKQTDPILHTNTHVETAKYKKFVEPALRGRKEDKENKSEIISKSVDHLKSAYSIFFEKNEKGDETNKDLQDFTKKKKTHRKMFVNENGKTSIFSREDLTPDFKISRKYFPDKFVSMFSTDGLPEIDSEITKKEHIISNNGGIMPTKKHFLPKTSEDILKFNEKREQLNTEGNERNVKYYRSGSQEDNGITNLKVVISNSGTYNNTITNTNYSNVSSFNIINPRYSTIYSNRKDSKSNVLTNSSKKPKYPYAKDNMKDIFLQTEPKCEMKLTQKIGKNQFDILKHVPKYEWEK